MYLAVVAVALIAAARLVAQPIRADRRAVLQPFDPWSATLIGLQGADSGAFIDHGRATEGYRFIQRASRLVTGFPARSPEGAWWSITLVVDDELAAHLRGRGRPLRRRLLAQWFVPPTEATALDSLHRRLQTDSVILRKGLGGSDRDTWALRITFSYAMNLPAVLADYLAVAGIRGGFVDPDDGAQSGSLWKLVRDGERWTLFLREGLGDCTIACPHEREWVIEQVGIDSVRVRHLGEPRPRDPSK